eukprot:c3456_g1_i1 orf=340-645(+)
MCVAALLFPVWHACASLAANFHFLQAAGVGGRACEERLRRENRLFSAACIPVLWAFAFLECRDLQISGLCSLAAVIAEGISSRRRLWLLLKWKTFLTLLWI